MIKKLDIGNLALRLHKTGSDELCIDLPENSSVYRDERFNNAKIVGEQLCFNSLEDRNIYVSQYIFSKIKRRLHTEAKLLFDEAHEIIKNEIHHRDKASGRIIALGSKFVDPLSIAAELIQKGDNVFKLLHIIEAAFPHFKTINLESLTYLYKIQHEATKNDLARHKFDFITTEWLSEHLDIALELLNFLNIEFNNQVSGLLIDAILAISKTEYDMSIAITIANIKHMHSNNSDIYCAALGKLLLQDIATPQQIEDIALFIIKLIKSTDEKLKNQAIYAAATSIHKTILFDNTIAKLLDAENIFALSGVINSLYANINNFLHEDSIGKWLNLITFVNTNQQHLLDQLDTLLEALLDDSSRDDLVIDFLTKWTEKNHKPTSTGDAVFTEFKNCMIRLSKNKISFSKLITKWMLSDNSILQKNISNTLSNLASHNSIVACYNKEILDTLDLDDLILLSRRTVGYIHNHKQLLLLAMSFLTINNKDVLVFPLLRDMLINEIGRDYPESSILACQLELQATALPSIKVFLSEVTDIIENRIKTLDSLPLLTDLKPPLQLQRKFSRARDKQVSRLFSEINKNSILRQIATEIPIKAGIETFQYLEGSYRPPTKLKSFSHSIEIPRREVTDPVGYAIRLLHFRLARRDDK